MCLREVCLNQIINSLFDNNGHAFKPIFRCNAKPLTLVPGFGLDPQSDNSALLLPTCCYLKSLADPTLSLHDPLCQSMEYSLRWVHEDWIRFGHVHFMLFV